MALALPGSSPLPLGAVMACVGCAATITARRRSRLPDIHMRLTDFNRAVRTTIPYANGAAA